MTKEAQDKPREAKDEPREPQDAPREARDQPRGCKMSQDRLQYKVKMVKSGDGASEASGVHERSDSGASPLTERAKRAESTNIFISILSRCA